MPTQNTSEIKNKIISTLRRNGPSLPVHISREIESSSLFTSAFLSELVSEKKIKMSNMKVGNSPLYFLPGQEYLLEKFSHHLKSKEKEAYDLLKERKFLKDSEQEPAIRVALRSIKDFAVPFKKGEDIYWKFFNLQETEEKPKTTERQINQSISQKRNENELDIFDKKDAEKSEERERKKETQEPKKSSQKIKNKTKKGTVKSSKGGESDFFKKVKSFMSENSIELLDILSFSKKEIILKVKENNETKALIAYDRKRVNENDIVKSFEKTKDYNLPYMIMIKGEPYKKTKKFLNAVRKLDSIKKLGNK